MYVLTLLPTLLMNVNYGNYDFSSFNSGNGLQGSTNLSLSDSIGLDTEPFVCANPLFSTVNHQSVGMPQVSLFLACYLITASLR